MDNFLTEQRKKLDVIDFELLELLAKRYSIVKEIGDYKKANNIDIVQPDRINEILERCSNKALSYGMDETFAKNLFRLIIEEACRMESH